MKNTLLALLSSILLSTPLAATAQQYGDFIYSGISDDWGYTYAVTIIGYTGNGGAVTIPAYDGILPVISIGNSAFYNKPTLTSVMIPNTVTSIGSSAFNYCTSLTAFTVDAANASYSSLDGVLFSKSQTALIQYPGGKAGSYAIPGSVTGIGYGAFYGCTGLTSVTIPGSVTHIGNSAFAYCINLTSLFFKGDAPRVGINVFYTDYNATVYYLPGTTGWGAFFGGSIPYARPTSLWNPLMQSSGPGFGVGPAGFGFNITGTADIPIVVEACTNLANAAWVPLQSLNLTNGLFHFSDPNWTNYPARTYRIRSP